MSKVDLISREWCELVFEGRNKTYGAYNLRANAGSRQLRSVIIVALLIVAIFILAAVKSAVDAYIEANAPKVDEVTELQELKKDDKKQEEKKVEVQQEEVKPKVELKSSIAFTVPEIVDQVDESRKLKTQDQLQKDKVAIDISDIVGNDDAKAFASQVADKIQAGGETHQAEEDKNKVYAVVEQQPEFPGGEGALLSYINSHIKYPPTAAEEGVQGKVVLRFVVLENGQVGEVKVASSLHKLCDAEAVRVVKSLPRFVPGKQQGKAVKCWYTLPVRFVLQ